MTKKLLVSTFALLSSLFALATCPNTIFVGTTDNCHYRNFEIGSDQGNPQVTWSFGDGSQVTTGHFIGHNYLLPGSYTVTATYVSEGCPGGVILTTIVEITCDCIGVSASFTSNMPEGGPSYVQWNISTIGGSVFDQGICQFSNNDPDCSANLCLAAGCYRFSVFSPNFDLSDINGFQTTMLVNGQTMEVFDVEFNGTGSTYHFSFGVNSDCTTDCNLEVNVLQQTTELIVLTAAGQPEDAVVYWTQNGEPVNQGTITTFVLQPGINELCAHYETPDCPQGVSWCEVVEGAVENNCYLELTAIELETGLYEFTAFGNPEEYPMIWDFGDGSTLEATWVVMHQFSPGTYEVCGSTNTDLCGLQTACVTIIVPNDEPQCNIGIDVLEQSCEFVFLTATGIGNSNAVIWKLDGEIHNTGPYGEFELTPGTHEICAYYDNSACDGLVYACETFEVASCSECSPVIIGIDSYVNNGGTPALYFSIFNQTTNQQVVFDQIQYSAEDPYHDLSLCLPDGCYTLTIDNNNEIQLGEGVFVFLNIDGEPANYEPVSNDPISFTISFGVHSDCSGATDCQAAFEIVEGDVPGNYAFNNTSQNAENAQWLWDFGNGQTGTDMYSFTSYTEPGTYEVCLTMYVGECVSTTCHPLEVTQTTGCELNDVHVTITAEFTDNDFDFISAVLMNNGLEVYNWSAVFSGQIELSFDACVPDGCYSLQLSSLTPILANYLMAGISVNGIPVNVLEILQGATNGNVVFAVNSDCTINVDHTEPTTFNVYPNPGNEYINVQIPQRDQQTSIEIFDATGKLVHAVYANSTLSRIATNDWADGIYLIKIKSGEEMYTKNMVVNH